MGCHDSAAVVAHQMRTRLTLIHHSLSDKLVDAVPSRVLKTVREFVRNFVEGGGGAVPDPATTTTSNDGSPPKIPWVVTTRPWNEQG